MKKEDKNVVVETLISQINGSAHFYITDISALNAADTSMLRRKCFEKNIRMVVVKNTLLKLALDKANGEYKDLYDVLKGNTSVLFTEVGNEPAKLIKDFRKKHSKPILKGAYVEESIYLGDNQLDSLVSIKSKEELLGDLIALLQSPAKNVMSSLQSGSRILAGVVKTLSEK